MNRVPIWDLPTRLFHWLFAGGFAGAAVISLLLGEHSTLFPYHAIIGLTLGLIVVLRVVWGLVGTRYARFSSFAYGPGALIAYIKGVLFGGDKRHVGHNPGSAYAVFAMLALVAALAVTGVMLAQGNESVKDIHEILSWVMVGVVGVHVLGVATHTLLRHENITASMVHGWKDVEPAQGIASSMPIAALAFLVITGAWAIGLVGGFDPVTQSVTVPILGTKLQIGEAENERGERPRGSRSVKFDDDD